MIEVFIGNDSKTFHNRKSALKFMYMIRNKGYLVTGWVCDDPQDNEWLNRRFKQ